METLGFWPINVLQMMINNPSLRDFIRVLKYVISKVLNTTLEVFKYCRKCPGKQSKSNIPT